MAARRGLRVAGFLVAALLVGGMMASPALANLEALYFSTSTLIPFYDTSAGHASFLIVADAGGLGFVGGGGNAIPLVFYDTTCVKRADQVISLTANDVAILSVAALNPAAPAQGEILMGGPVGRVSAPFYADVLNVDFTNGTATLLNGIPTLFVGFGWTHFSPGAVLTFGPKEAAPFSTTVTMICPRSDLGTAMVGPSTISNFPLQPFFPATGTQTTNLDLFIFDLDEKFLGSLHGIACQCTTRKALKDWAPQALTSDVLIYFHGQITPTSATGVRGGVAANELVPLTGFYETVVNLGTTKFYWSSYLHTTPQPTH